MFCRTCEQSPTNENASVVEGLKRRNAQRSRQFVRTQLNLEVARVKFTTLPLILRVTCKFRTAQQRVCRVETCTSVQKVNRKFTNSARAPASS